MVQGFLDRGARSSDRGAISDENTKDLLSDIENQESTTFQQEASILQWGGGFNIPLALPLFPPIDYIFLAEIHHNNKGLTNVMLPERALVT